MPGVLLGDVLEKLEFPGPHLMARQVTALPSALRTEDGGRSTYRARANVTDFSTLDHVVESAYELFVEEHPGPIGGFAEHQYTSPASSHSRLRHRKYSFLTSPCGSPKTCPPLGRERRRRGRGKRYWLR